MYIYFFIFLIILLIASFLIVRTNNIHHINHINKNLIEPVNPNMKKYLDTNDTNNTDNISPEEINNLESCQVPTLTTEQCYKSRFFECPIVNGSYLQCTNNYIPKPTQYNADCGNRTFDMVPPPWKISENCYYNKINFNRNKKYDKVKFVN